MRITEYRTYDEAVENYSFDQVWELFDGNQEKFNITHECIDRHKGKGIAVRIKFENGQSEQYNFDEISRLSSQFSNALESLYVDFGDRVAIMMNPSLEFYVSLFGTLKRGAIVVPCFPLFGPEALRQRLNDSAAKILVTSSDKTNLVGGKSKVGLITGGAQFKKLIEKQSDKYEANTSSKDISVYQYTSGTTRKYAEAVKHYHRSIVPLMPAAIFGRGLSRGDRFFCPSSPAWGHGLWVGTFAPLALGISIATYSGKFDVAKLLDALEEFEINNISAAPTIFRMIKKAGVLDNYKLKIKKIHYTGEPMDTGTFNFLKEKLGVSPVSGYGSTEVGPIIYNYAGFENWIVKPGSMGKPMPGLEIQIVDRNGNEVLPGTIGEIVLKRKGKWFRVKDSAVKDDDGYFWHKGRADDIIISAGWTISPNEVEDVLLMHNAVQEAVVVGVPDEDRGQIVKAYVVTRSEHSKSLEKELKDFVKYKLSMHEYPREIEFMESLPKTEGGKIKRKELKERDLKSEEDK